MLNSELSGVQTVAPDSEQMIFNQISNLQVPTDIIRGLISYRLLSFFCAILFKKSELARRVPMERLRLSKTAIFPKKEGSKREISNESARGSSLRKANV